MFVDRHLTVRSHFVIVIYFVIYLLTLHISILLRIDSEERMIFLGGHPAKYWSPTIVCAVHVCVSACVLLCPVFVIAVHLGNKVIIYPLSPLTS